MIRTETLCVEVHLSSKGTLELGLQSLRELNYVVVRKKIQEKVKEKEFQ